MEINEYKKMINSAPIGYAYHKILRDKSGTPHDYIFLDANKAYEEYTGLSPEEIIGKKASDIFPQSSKSFVNAAVYSYFSSEGNPESFVETSHISGKDYLVNCFSDTKDHFAAFLLSLPDDLNYRNLFYTMPESCCIYRVLNGGQSKKDFVVIAQNTPISMNNTFFKADSIGKTFFQSISNGLDADNIFQILKNVWATGSPEKATIKEAKVKKEFSFYEARAFKISKEAIAFISCDITAHQKLLLEYKENSDRLAKYIEMAPYGIVIIDKFGNCIEANAASAKLTEFTREEILKRKVIDFVPKQERIKILNTLITLKKEHTLDTNIRYVTRDGKTKWFSVRAIELNNNKYISIIVDVTERVNLENKLRESEEEYRTLFNTAGMAIGYFDTQGTIISFNEMAARTLGGRPNDFIGKTISDLLAPPHANVFMERMNQTISSDKPHEYDDVIDFPYLKVAFKSTFSSVKDKNGNVKGIQIISNDITDLRNSQKALAESEKKYKAIFDQAALGIIHISLDHTITDANRKACEIFGYSSLQMVGRNLNDLVYEKDVAINRDKTKELLTGHGKNIGYECRYIKNGGEILNVQVNLNSIDDENGNHVSFIAAIEDITEKRKTENLLKRFETISSSLITGNALAELSGKVIYTNEYFANIHGYSSDEIIGQNLSVFHSKQQKQQVDEFNEKLISDSYIDPIEIWHINKDGKEFPMLMSGILLKDSDGNPEYLAVTAIDITNYKKLEEKNTQMQMILQNQQKLESIGTLASGVAHEINNPINGIMNYSQLIADTTSPESENYLFATEIISETKRIASIVQSLLQFSRQGKTTYSPAYIEDIINSTMMLIETLIKRNSINFAVDIEKNLPQILCRSQQIQQVILNLITNASDSLIEKFDGGYDEKSIVLSAKLIKKNQKDFIQISVKDNGTGIDPSIKGQIFDPFFTTKTRDKGTGLGLAITFGIVHDHGGEIYFDSEKGKYSIFYVNLPVSRERE